MRNEKRVNPLMIILATVFIVIGLSDINVLAEKKGYWRTEHVQELYETTTFEDVDLSGEIESSETEVK